MPNIIKAEIIAKRHLSADEFAIDLRCPEIAAEAAPGRFVMVRGSEAIDPITPRPISLFARILEGGEAVGFTLIIKLFGRAQRLSNRTPWATCFPSTVRSATRWRSIPPGAI